MGLLDKILPKTPAVDVGVSVVKTPGSPAVVDVNVAAHASNDQVCPACNHTTDVDDGGDLRGGIYFCEHCGNKIFFGQVVFVDTDLSDPTKPLVIFKAVHVDWKEPRSIPIEARDVDLIIGIANSFKDLVKKR